MFGRFITVATIRLPENSCGRYQPMVLTSGLKREPHRVAQHQPPFRQALGARRHHVGLVQLVQQVGAHDAREPRGAGDAEDERRQPEMLEQIRRTWPSSTARRRYSGENRPVTLMSK